MHNKDNWPTVSIEQQKYLGNRRHNPTLSGEFSGLSLPSKELIDLNLTPGATALFSLGIQCLNDINSSVTNVAVTKLPGVGFMLYEINGHSEPSTIIGKDSANTRRKPFDFFTHSPGGVLIGRHPNSSRVYEIDGIFDAKVPPHSEELTTCQDSIGTSNNHLIISDTGYANGLLLVMDIGRNGTLVTTHPRVVEEIIEYLTTSQHKTD